jgi:hypothetical protein
LQTRANGDYFLIIKLAFHKTSFAKLASFSLSDQIQIESFNFLKKPTLIQKLSTEEQKTVFSFLDAFLRDTKTRKAYAA